MRGHNIQFVLALIQHYGPISRPWLAQRSGLTKASITRIVQLLSDIGLVELDPCVDADTGGRPAELIRMKSGQFLSVGVDLRIDRWTILVRDLSGVELARESFLPDPNAEALPVLENIAETIKRLLQPLPHSLMGVGVAIGGSPYPDHKGILDSPYLGWRDVDVEAILRRKLGAADLHCFVHDVASCAAEANAAVVSADERADLLHVQCGIGLGAGRPTPLNTALPDAFTTSDIGHLPFSATETACPMCGWQGCVDAVLGFQALAQRTSSLGIEVLPQPDFIIRYCEALAAKWHAGDEVATAMVRDLAHDLARLIVLLIMMQKASVVTLGGWSSHLGQEFVALVESIIRSNPLVADVRVDISQLGDDASAVGAAILGAMEGVTRAVGRNG